MHKNTIIGHKKTYLNGNLEAIKLVSDVITALSPENVDPLAWTSLAFSCLHKLKVVDT
jgi:hypothetical protein